MKWPDNEAVTVPNFYIVTVNNAFCLGNSFPIVAADQRLKSYEVPINAHSINSIFQHGPYSKGRNSPLRSLATSGERSGSSPAQSRHWNLRPPVLRSKNRMGFLHFGQIGGGVFLGMRHSHWIRREYRYSLSPIIADDGAVINIV